MTTFLEVRHLGLSLGGRRILDRVSCTLGRGQCLAVVGPNGAGKSSLLRCLGQICTVYSGEVLLEGAALRHIPQKKIARRIAWVPQGGTDRLPFTVRQFALMARYPWKEPFSGETDSDGRIIADAMALAGVGNLADRPMNLLSGGERQRALIASALAQETDILFLDEPTSFLDYRHQVETAALIERVIGEGGKTVVLVTHDINLALRCAGRIVALKEGSVLQEGEPETFLDEGLLAAIFHAEFRSFTEPGQRFPHMVPRRFVR